mmetsp:Transcript_35717/g.93091  ORF Transcript_35717/g.93091 Transcript_35717/m.93091 type:complete len:310 (-) Transcript_35717:213-1142(-)
MSQSSPSEGGYGEAKRLVSLGKIEDAWETVKDMEPDDDGLHEYLRETHKHFLAFKEDINDIDGYKQTKSGHLKMWYRHRKGQPVHNVRFETELDTFPSHLVSIAREFDLIKKWDWMGKGFVKDTAVIAGMRNFELDAIARLWMPWPMKNRQVLLHACGVDRLDEEGKMYILFKTTHEDDIKKRLSSTDVSQDIRDRAEGLLATYAADSRKYQDTLVELSGIEITPIQQDKLYVRMTLHADPRLSIAAPLVEFFLKIFFPFAFKLIVKQLYKLKKPNSPYHERIAMRPYLYDVIEKRTAEFLGGVQDGSK